MTNNNTAPENTVNATPGPGIRNHLVFALVMRKEKMVKTCLERILNKKIRKITYIEPEKTLEVAVNTHGIRVDIYCENEEAVYNIEIQAYVISALGKRSRYYQGMLDMNLLRKSEDYKKLKKNIVIFICTYDPFGLDRYLYTFENRCTEKPELSLGDETTKIFLNTTGHIGDIPSPLQKFLHYIETNEVTDDFTREMNKEVIEVRNDNKWRDKIMTIEQVLEDCAYDTEIRTTEKVTKEVTERVTKEVTEKVTNENKRNFVFRMLEQELSAEIICRSADISEEQYNEYKKEYESLK